MKKILVVIFLVYCLGLFYLALPEPVIPNLPDSVKSTEPGDTWQIPGVWAYYTNLSRREVVDFYQEAFSRSPFLNFPLLTYILNHPPEYAQETIRETQETNFYEEIVHPLRESLFISGWGTLWGWTSSARPEYVKPGFVVGDELFIGKVTLYHVQSPLWARVLVWTGIVVLLAILVYTLIAIIHAPWQKRK